MRIPGWPIILSGLLAIPIIAIVLLAIAFAYNGPWAINRSQDAIINHFSTYDISNRILIEADSIFINSGITPTIIDLLSLPDLANQPRITLDDDFLNVEYGGGFCHYGIEIYKTPEMASVSIAVVDQHYSRIKINDRITFYREIK